MCDVPLIPVARITPAPLPLNDARDLLRWYRVNLCEAVIEDPRGYRVRFLPANFIHLIKLTNKHGQEPKNARLALEEIEKGRIRLVAGRFDPQRTAELTWIRLVASDPLMIVPNWQALGRGTKPTSAILALSNSRFTGCLSVRSLENSGKPSPYFREKGYPRKKSAGYCGPKARRPPHRVACSNPNSRPGLGNSRSFDPQSSLTAYGSFT
jgi:hypothetical protein